MVANQPLSRRGLIAGAAGLGSFLAIGAQACAALEKKPRVRVGLLGAITPDESLTSSAEHWDDLDLAVTHVWDADRTQAERFASSLPGVEVVSAFDQMAGSVDGVVLCDPRLTAWNDKIAERYLAGGTPVWIEGPAAYSMGKAQKLVETAQRTGAPLGAGCVEEFLPTTRLLGRKARELAPITAAMASVNTLGRIKHQWSGYEGAAVGFSIFGPNANKMGRIVTEDNEPNYALTFEYGGERPMHAVIHGTPGAPDLVWGRLYGKDMVDKGHPAVDISQEGWISTYLPAAIAVQRMFTSKKPAQPYENLLKKTRLFLTACRASQTEGGKEFEVEKLPGDWEAENPFPGHVSRV